MPNPDISLLGTQVLWAAFFISVVFGAISQKTHFCTMGAVSDIVNMGSWVRMRQWVLAIGVAMLGFNGLVFAGLIDPGKTLYAANRVLIASALVGGLMFGFGMVLASGCGSKTLVRIGGGSLKALVVFVVMGVSAFATLKGITAVLRVASIDRVAVDIAAPGNLSHWVMGQLGSQNPASPAIFGIVLGFALLVWCFGNAEFRSRLNVLAGLGIGVCVVAMWYTSGHWGYVSEHPDTLQEAFLRTNSGRAEALSFVSPVAYTLDWLMFFSDKSKVLTVGIVSVFGVVVGSWLLALLTRSFRWEGFRNAQDTGMHLVGAALMGIGGVSAMGCTVGQGLSGISTLSFTSFLAVLGIVVGAVLAIRFQIWLIERADD